MLALASLITLGAESDGKMGGAGLSLKVNPEGRLMVEKVAANGAAAKVGLQPGDWLVAVNRRAVAELTGEQLVDIVRGPVGTKLELVYIRDGSEPTAVVLTRQSLTEEQPQPTKSNSTPPPTEVRNAPRQGTIRFTQERIMDPAANNVAALTFLLPKGWRFQGDILWLHEFSVLANLRLKMWEDGGQRTIEWLPTQHFSYTDQLPGLLQPGANWMGAIVAAPISDPEQFLQVFYAPTVLPHLRNLRPTGRESFPALAQQAVARDPGWRAQAVRLRFEFERDERPWEQDVYFTLAYAPVNGGVAMWNVQRAFTCSAPKGVLDSSAMLIKSIVANANYTPEWLATYSVVQQLRRQGLQQQMADTAAFGRKLQDYNAHIQQLGQQMHEERMKSFDRIAESQREYLGGVETYTDPFKAQGIYMPAGYKEYWVNPKGEVILSEQIGYDPNVGGTDDWRKMVRRKPGAAGE